MNGAIETRFTLDDVENRRFAVLTGYDEWASQSSFLVGEIEEQLLPHDVYSLIHIDREIRDTYRYLSTAVCRSTCEVGFKTRDEVVVVMPSPAKMAYAVDPEVKPFQAKLAGSWRADEEEALVELHTRLVQVLPNIAEAAFLWGRHGKLLEVVQSPPTVVRENGLVTIRPAGIDNRTSDALEKVYGAVENHRPFEPSIAARALALVSKKKRMDIWDQVMRSDIQLRDAIRKTVHAALTDLASEA